MDESDKDKIVQALKRLSDTVRTAEETMDNLNKSKIRKDMAVFVTVIVVSVCLLFPTLFYKVGYSNGQTFEKIMRMRENDEIQSKLDEMLLQGTIKGYLIKTADGHYVWADDLKQE
jgi:hypothetical protein